MSQMYFPSRTSLTTLPSFSSLSSASFTLSGLASGSLFRSSLKVNPFASRIPNIFSSSSRSAKLFFFSTKKIRVFALRGSSGLKGRPEAVVLEAGRGPVGKEGGVLEGGGPHRPPALLIKERLRASKGRPAQKDNH